MRNKTLQSKELARKKAVLDHLTSEMKENNLPHFNLKKISNIVAEERQSSGNQTIPD